MRYSAFAYRQKENAPLQVCLIAPSCDLDQWAKVPVRLSGQPHGFQRAEVPKHVAEIRAFFSGDETKTNSSPTAVLVGVSPEADGQVRLLNAEGDTQLDTQKIGVKPVPCHVVIDFEPWD